MISITWVLNTITRDLKSVSVGTQALKDRVDRGILKISVSKKTMYAYGGFFITVLTLVICIPAAYPYNKYFAGVALIAVGGLTIVKHGLDIYWERSNRQMSYTNSYEYGVEPTNELATEAIEF